MARIEKLEYITVSSIQDYQDDRLRWCYKWVENRVPRKVPSALVVGKLLHKAFEVHFKTGVSVANALEALLPPIGTVLDEKEQKEVSQARGLVEPLSFWQDTVAIETTLEVEQPFEFYLTSGAKFRGRPDRVVLAYGKVFHEQHKSVAAGVKVDTFLMLMMESLHELLYGVHLAKKYNKQGLVYGGTIANLVRKLKYRSMARISKKRLKELGLPEDIDQKSPHLNPHREILHTPGEMLFQQVLPISKNSMIEAYDEVNEVSVFMDRTMELYLSGKSIPRNRRLDAGKYGNSLDPYTLVALGEIKLEDDTYFMDREETYDEEIYEDEPTAAED